MIKELYQRLNLRYQIAKTKMQAILCEIETGHYIYFNVDVAFAEKMEENKDPDKGQVTYLSEIARIKRRHFWATNSLRIFIGYITSKVCRTKSIRRRS